MATIAYTPNDPLASGGPPARHIRPSRLPSGDVATFKVQPSAVAGTYPPLTPEFDYWQTLTALVAGLKTWKAIEGSSLHRWFGNQKTLPVLTNSGDDLNAFYDRSSLQFFAHTFGGVTVHSAESTDVVTHEEGHGLLDAIRSDFFDVPFIEVGALHEAFGDCMAILTAISDKGIRDAMLAASPDLSGNQFVESLAEQLGDAIRREYGPQSVEKGALRHALNTFSWSDPTALPPSAPADKLCGEVHSFSRVFSGAFYDVIRNIYRAGTAHVHRAPEGRPDVGQAARRRPQDRPGGPAHLRRRRPAHAPGRHHHERRGECHGDPGGVQGPRHDADGSRGLAAGAARQANARRRVG